MPTTKCERSQQYVRRRWTDTDTREFREYPKHKFATTATSTADTGAIPKSLLREKKIPRNLLQLAKSLNVTFSSAVQRRTTAAAMIWISTIHQTVMPVRIIHATLTAICDATHIQAETLIAIDAIQCPPTILRTTVTNITALEEIVMDIVNNTQANGVAIDPEIHIR